MTSAGDEIHGETFAAGLPDKYLDCRELNHSWQRWTIEWDGEAKAYVRQLRCRVCKSVRKMLVGDDGDVVKTGYDYAKGYLATNVVKGTLSRSVFRLEGITREMTKKGYEMDEKPTHLRQVS